LETEVLLVSAIANTDYLLAHLATQFKVVHTLEFEDHHYFAEDELHDIKRRFENIKSKNKIILTTEKDATRLELHGDFFWKNQLPVWVLPVEVQFCDEDERRFKTDVQQFLKGFKT
jgi:tetraacyldisaccharide 4'-kinase